MAALLNSGMERAARAQEAAFTSVGKEQKKRGKEETVELKREERTDSKCTGIDYLNSFLTRRSEILFFRLSDL